MKNNFFERKRWHYFLLLIAIIVIAISVSYTNKIAQQLRADELAYVELWSEALKKILSSNSQDMTDLTFPSYIITNNNKIPVIRTDTNFRVQEVINFDVPMADTAYYRKEIEYLRTTQEPIVINDNKFTHYVFYKESMIITSLKWFPLVQFAILGALVLFTYVTFSSSRNAEKERLWVGMAKETAHQLGTPITSLMAWIEHQKDRYPEDEHIAMISKEMETDVELLKLVADRFSKIGTVPTLEKRNIYAHLVKHHDYLRQRASRKIQFDFPEGLKEKELYVMISPLLFDWVVENLLKNALDALEGEGSIKTTLHSDNNFTILDISDTGKGIPKNILKKVFSPGFTTKERGWGLGLSLCKRIIEKYHNGKVFVLNTTEGKGTTFRIQLPKI